MAIQVIGLGAGGHAKVLVDLLRLTGEFELVGLVDANQQLWGQRIMGVLVLGGDEKLMEWKTQGVRHLFMGLGLVHNLTKRREIFQHWTQQGFTFVTAIHPRAVVAAGTQIGIGVTVMAGAVVNPAVALGDNTVVNTGAVIEHDCILAAHAQVASGAVLTGGVTVGEASLIGAGATIRPGIKIGANVVVGAGAAVIEDVGAGLTVMGVPARAMHA